MNSTFITDSGRKFRLSTRPIGHGTHQWIAYTLENVRITSDIIDHESLPKEEGPDMDNFVGEVKERVEKAMSGKGAEWRKGQQGGRH